MEVHVRQENMKSYVKWENSLIYTLFLSTVNEFIHFESVNEIMNQTCVMVSKKCNKWFVKILVSFMQSNYNAKRLQLSTFLKNNIQIISVQ